MGFKTDFYVKMVENRDTLIKNYLKIDEQRQTKELMSFHNDMIYGIRLLEGTIRDYEPYKPTETETETTLPVVEPTETEVESTKTPTKEPTAAKTK